jgi:hypothetical protein
MNITKHTKLQLLIKKVLGLDGQSHFRLEQARVQMLSASIEHPTISTLVYKDANIDCPISETFNQDKMMLNAKQILASMDHTTASRH